MSHFGPAYLRLQWSHASHASVDEELIIHPEVRRPTPHSAEADRLRRLSSAPRCAGLQDAALQLSFLARVSLRRIWLCVATKRNLQGCMRCSRQPRTVAAAPAPSLCLNPGARTLTTKCQDPEP